MIQKLSNELLLKGLDNVKVTKNKTQFTKLNNELIKRNIKVMHKKWIQCSKCLQLHLIDYDELKPGERATLPCDKCDTESDIFRCEICEKLSLMENDADAHADNNDDDDDSSHLCHKNCIETLEKMKNTKSNLFSLIKQEVKIKIDKSSRILHEDYDDYISLRD